MQIDGTEDKIYKYISVYYTVMDYCWLLLFEGASSGGFVIGVGNIDSRHQRKRRSKKRK